MAQPDFDIVIPLFKPRWNTRATLEGLTQHYAPRSLQIITPASEVEPLTAMLAHWDTAPVVVHNEDVFFQAQTGLSKADICAELDLGESLYNPGWFYQQLLKLGAFIGIPDLSEWYLVWDSDLLPVATWPVVTTTADPVAVHHAFALIQHKNWGNPAIVAKWATWIETVLGVDPAIDVAGTFVPHHMWFKQAHLSTFAQRINQFFASEDHWLRLMMRSPNLFGTFSEYWAYVSWVAAQAPEDLSFYPYAQYGETSERFFDDGTGLFSAALRNFHAIAAATDYTPSYAEVSAFITATYGSDPLPSSIAFESSPRHLKKNEDTMHIEELRSRWNPRLAESVIS